jgi:hypothetical protein
MLTKWLVFFKKQYFILSGFLLLALLLLLLPVWQADKQSEAMPAEENKPVVKKHKSEQYADVFLPIKEKNQLHDPFLLSDKLTIKEVPKEMVKEATITEKPVPLPEQEPVSLVGILRKDDKAKAMIQLGSNMVSVEAGAHIAAYEVLAIGEQEVVLEGPEGRLVLRFAKH